MSDFRDELQRRQLEARERPACGRQGAEQAAVAATPAAARWLEALALRCREAEAAAGPRIRVTAPRVDGAGRSIRVLHRGTVHWKSLRLLLDHGASLLTWQHVENGWVRQSGQVSMRDAEPNETIGRLVGDFMEWSADVAHSVSG
jgi:hypothetical protein